MTRQELNRRETVLRARMAELQPVKDAPDDGTGRRRKALAEYIECRKEIGRIINQRKGVACREEGVSDQE